MISMALRSARSALPHNYRLQAAAGGALAQDTNRPALSRRA
jgi:hypothetical protein